MDKETRQEILNEINKHLEKIKYGKIQIELCETSAHVDIKTEKSKRIYKEKKGKDYDIKGKFHKG